MQIRKSFNNISNMHIVRNCSSERCKKSLHAHSYQVEIFLESDKLDNGFMTMDFGLTKGTIKDFISSFHNSYTLWDKETSEYKNLIKNKLDRIIELPVSPSAESFSVMFFLVIDNIIKVTQMNNGEGNGVHLSKVSVHETRTGYASCDKETFKKLCNYNLEDIKISDGVKNEWKDFDMYEKLKEATKNNTKCFINPIVEQQV